MDAFQGQERDVMLFSCVKTAVSNGFDKRSKIGSFVSDVRRINVAITRAKKACWIVGRSSTLANDPTWSALIDDAKRRNCFDSTATPESVRAFLCKCRGREAGGEVCK